MYKLFPLHCFFILLQALASAQNSDTLAFPAAWAGHWHGTLDIYNTRAKTASVPMWVEIQKIDTSTSGRYTFGLVYGSREQDWRPYELAPVAPEKGVWRVDEKNGIVLDSYLCGPKFLCWFTVQGNRVLCTYELRGGEMLFEVYSGKEAAVSTTGNTKQGDEVIPEVQTFPFSFFQRAVLKKQ